MTGLRMLLSLASFKKNNMWLLEHYEHLSNTVYVWPYASHGAMRKDDDDDLKWAHHVLMVASFTISIMCTVCCGSDLPLI